MVDIVKARAMQDVLNTFDNLKNTITTYVRKYTNRGEKEWLGTEYTSIDTIKMNVRKKLDDELTHTIVDKPRNTTGPTNTGPKSTGPKTTGSQIRIGGKYSRKGKSRKGKGRKGKSRTRKH